MTTKLITPPAELAVSIESARASARIDGADFDAQLMDAIRTYTAEAQHQTGRSFVNQTFRVTLDRFPDAVRLDSPPIVSVTHVKFHDMANQLQTLSPQDYMVDSVSEPGFVVPAPAKAWPATAGRINAVEVQYVAGYGPDHSTVPDGVKGYILARVAEQFLGLDRSEHVDRLLDPYRLY